MENCLVTKLKASVQNEQLVKVNEMKISVKQTTSISAEECKIEIQNTSEPMTIRTTGGYKMYSSFADLQAGTNGYTERTVSSIGTLVAFIEPGDYNVFVSNKYDFRRFANGNVMPVWKVDVDNFKFSTKLKEIKLLSSSMMGDASNVFKLPLMEIINFTGAGNLEGNIDDIESTTLQNLELKDCVKITGDVKTLGKNTNLVWVNLSNTQNIIGSLEGFVAISQKNGRSSCNGMTFKITNSNIQFNGSTHVSATSQTLSWGPNASDSSNTDVTWNNQTTTIHVNSDGSWTRIS